MLQVIDKGYHKAFGSEKELCATRLLVSHCSGAVVLDPVPF